MTIARSNIVTESVEGVYHCVSRCVRRAYLCGSDHYSGQNYDHRKGWVQGRLRHLAKIFTIDICGYAVMSNHVHLVLRNRPDDRAALSDRDVAKRWRELYPKHFSPNAGKGAREQALQSLLNNKERIAVLRDRLGSISWFMKCLNEPIARHANLEDGCTGHFWEGRFRCQALLDEAAILACMAYVDLNPVRAGLAVTPEGSHYTSVHDHIEHRQAATHIKVLKQKRGGTPLSISQKQALVADREHLKADDWLCPVEDQGAFRKGGVHGVLPMTLDQYLELLDWTGRRIVAGKRGAIPKELKPILDRLQVDAERWVETVTDFGRLFHLVAGHVTAMFSAAHRAGRHWFQGLGPGSLAFPDSPAPG